VKTENQKYDGQQVAIQPSLAVSGSRRKLIRGGAIGVPVVLALKSTPVLACNCKLPSGFSASGNLSRNGGASCKEPAKGPSYWMANVNTYNNFRGTGGVSKDRKFKDVFGGSDVTTFFSILGANTFASLVVAAYLDLKSNQFKNPDGTLLASEQNIKDMWNGIYKPPGSSLSWTTTQSENYLRYVMGL